MVPATITMTTIIIRNIICISITSINTTILRLLITHIANLSQGVSEDPPSRRPPPPGVLCEDPLDSCSRDSPG